MVVAHNAPWSFVLTDLQPEIRVLGLVSNLTKPTDRTLFQAEMRAILEAHAGDIYLLSSASFFTQGLEVLRDHFGLVPTGEGSLRIETRLQPSRIDLFPVARTEP